MRRVVITGLGFVCSIGNDKASVLSNLRDLNHGFENVTYFDNPECRVKVIGSVKGFDTDSPYWQNWKAPLGKLPEKKVLMSLPPHGLYAHHALLEAIQDSGLSRTDISSERTGLFCASSGSAFLTWNNMSEMNETKGTRGTPFGLLSSVCGTLNFNFGASLGIQGCNCGFASACASSAHALAYAYDEIALGRQDTMIVIGAEDLNAATVLPFSAMRVLSCSGDPATASRPFDQRRDGFIASGGASVLILEAYDSAVKRNVVPYCEFAGWGQSADGYNPAMPQPEGKGLLRAMRFALASTGTQEKNVDYINAHATSTMAGDKAEIRAISALYGTGVKIPPISSTKALTGHTLSMAGALEASFCALAIKNKILPGAAHLEQPDAEFEAIDFPRKTLDADLKVVLSNSCGFGGSNVTLVFKKYYNS